MDLKYKSQDRFSERLGGYTSDSGASLGEEWQWGIKKVVINTRKKTQQKLDKSY